MGIEKRNIWLGALLCVALVIGACSGSDESATDSPARSDSGDSAAEPESELEAYLSSDERAQRLDRAVNAFAEKVLALEASGTREFAEPYNIHLDEASEGWRTLDTYGNEEQAGYGVIMYYDENGAVVREKGAIEAFIYPVGEPEGSAHISLAGTTSLYQGESLPEDALPYSEVMNAPGFKADYLASIIHVNA